MELPYFYVVKWVEPMTSEFQFPMIANDRPWFNDFASHTTSTFHQSTLTQTTLAYKILLALKSNLSSLLSQVLIWDLYQWVIGALMGTVYRIIEHKVKAKSG